MTYTLYHGDCLEHMQGIADHSIDAVIADVPSGRTNCAWDSVIPFKPMWAALKRVAKKHAPIVLLGCTQPFTSALVMSNVEMFRYEWVWRKGRPSGHLNANRQPMNAHESIVVFSQASHIYIPQRTKGARSHSATAKTNTQSMNYGAQRNDYNIVPYNDLKFPNTILDFPKCAGGLHPTQKPLELLEYLVRTYTNPGDTVLDFCFGSGTCGHACGNLGRSFIGIEKDAGYFTIGSDRIASAYEPLREMVV